MTTHDLKTVQPYFDAVRDRTKTFEVRRNDRGFAVGDTLRLHEWHPDFGYSGRLEDRVVTYVLSEYKALASGFVVMSIAPPASDEGQS